jgi:monoamine oxidase
VGHNVTILESSNRPGGRIKTARGESFSGDMYAEKGAMRLPCAHWLTHAYVLRYGLEKRPFHTYNEEAMFFFEGLGRPYPKKYFDPDSSSFNQTLLNMLLDAYNITNANERVWSGKLFDTTMQQFVDDVTASGNWTKYIALFDGYSNREFLQSRGWSDGAIRMWAVTQNVETIINFDFLETFRDYVGMWFSDACVFNFPSPDPNGLFTGLPTQGLWELVGGTDVLTTAMFRDVQDNVLFGHRVIAIDRSLNTSVRVTYEVNGVYTSSMSFDYLLVSVPFSALRHIIVTPPFSDG